MEIRFLLHVHTYYTPTGSHLYGRKLELLALFLGTLYSQIIHIFSEFKFIAMQGMEQGGVRAMREDCPVLSGTNIPKFVGGAQLNVEKDIYKGLLILS